MLSHKGAREPLSSGVISSATSTPTSDAPLSLDGARIEGFDSLKVGLSSATSTPVLQFEDISLPENFSRIEGLTPLVDGGIFLSPTISTPTSDASLPTPTSDSSRPSSDSGNGSGGSSAATLPNMSPVELSSDEELMRRPPTPGLWEFAAPRGVYACLDTLIATYDKYDKKDLHVPLVNRLIAFKKKLAVLYKDDNSDHRDIRNYFNEWVPKISLNEYPTRSDIKLFLSGLGPQGQNIKVIFFIFDSIVFDLHLITGFLPEPEKGLSSGQKREQWVAANEIDNLFPFFCIEDYQARGQLNALTEDPGESEDLDETHCVTLLALREQEKNTKKDSIARVMDGERAASNGNAVVGSPCSSSSKELNYSLGMAGEQFIMRAMQQESVPLPVQQIVSADVRKVLNQFRVTGNLNPKNFLETLEAKLRLARHLALPAPVCAAITFVLSFLACFSIGLATGIPVLAVGTFVVLTPLSLFAVNKLVSNKPRHSREPNRLSPA